MWFSVSISRSQVKIPVLKHGTRHDCLLECLDRDSAGMSDIPVSVLCLASENSRLQTSQTASPRLEMLLCQQTTATADVPLLHSFKKHPVTG